MSIFNILDNKKSCSLCKKEKKDIWAITENGTEKPLCTECLKDMKIFGFKEYLEELQGTLKNISYTLADDFSYLKKYVEYYNVISSKNDILDQSMITKIEPYQDLYIQNDEIVAITISEVNKVSEENVMCYMICYITENELVPVFTKEIKLAGDNKTRVENIEEILFEKEKSVCHNVEYNITDAEKLRKFIKLQNDYSSKIPIEEVLDILESISMKKGYFSEEALQKRVNE